MFVSVAVAATVDLSTSFLDLESVGLDPNVVDLDCIRHSRSRLGVVLVIFLFLAARLLAVSAEQMIGRDRNLSSFAQEVA
jgi:hypothetical protein